MTASAVPPAMDGPCRPRTLCRSTAGERTIFRSRSAGLVPASSARKNIAGFGLPSEERSSTPSWRTCGSTHALRQHCACFGLRCRTVAEEETGREPTGDVPRGPPRPSFCPQRHPPGSAVGATRRTGGWPPTWAHATIRWQSITRSAPAPAPRLSAPPARHGGRNARDQMFARRRAGLARHS